MSLGSQLESHVRSACYRPYMNSPTVTHEPGLSTAYENGELFSGESLMHVYAPQLMKMGQPRDMLR